MVRRSLGWPVAVFLAARLILTAFGVVLFVLGLVPLAADPVLRPYFGLAPVTEGWRGALLGIWLRFDAVHYLRIAEGDYSATDLSVFYPLYPLLTRWVALLVGGDSLLAGLLVSNTAAAAALVVFYRWTQEEFEDEGLARRATLYLAFFPTAFFLLVPYPESLCLWLTLLALREYRNRRWPCAAAAALAASLTRPQAGVLAVALCLDLFRQWQSGRKPAGASLLAPVGAITGVLAFLAYRAWLGFPAMSLVQSAYWGRITSLPFTPVAATLRRLVSGEAAAIELVDLVVVLVMLVVGVIALQRLPPLFGIYHWALLLLNLSLMRIPQPISSQARFALGLFPAFLVLGRMGSSPRAHRLIFYPSFFLWALLAGEFVLWGWVG